MPSYLDFNSTNNFRKVLIGRTLQQPNGPQTFTSNNYEASSLLDLPNISGGGVTEDQLSELKQSKTINIYKPSEYYEKDLEVLPRNANLQLYPYFAASDHSLVGIVGQTDNTNNESALYKFAVSNILNNPNGPVHSRIAQNNLSAGNDANSLSTLFNSNQNTVGNIIGGKQPLVKVNNSITVDPNAKTNVVNFFGVLEGTDSYETTIPGQYLTNPNNPFGSGPSTTVGNFVQDATGVLGSLLGAKNPLSLQQRPSDLFFEYLGSNQKQNLLDNLSYNSYAPDYSSTAMGLTSTGGPNIAGLLGIGLLSAAGLGNPPSTAYIGDDRIHDVYYAMNDFNDRPVRSPYYLSLLFDPVQTKLLQIDTNIGENGRIGGNLVWMSYNSTKLNKLGADNQQWNGQSSDFSNIESTNFVFPENSILGQTQDLLNILPNTGGSARAHVANVIDQTSRIFQDGDVFMARGAAVQYTDQYGQQKGIEFCRTWTKDRPYYSYSDLMPLASNTNDIKQKKYIPTSTPYRRTNIRKYDSSVLSSTWNLNIAPMSDGNKGFTNSTNISSRTAGGKDFYAKKYMLSIENLAWATSNTPGYTVSDLPFDERGPNGGRVMWFPPYDLKVSENNTASWEKNMFIGRPEPIYTYQNTTRTGQLSFKVVVDHPSILNLLTREYFKNVPDDQADNYINAYFAGCQDLDFYTLVRTYTNLNDTDINLVLSYLNKNADPQTISNYKTQTIPPATQQQPTTPTGTEVTLPNSDLFFQNDYPINNGTGINEFKSIDPYSIFVNEITGTTYQNIAINNLTNGINNILTSPTDGNDLSDLKILSSYTDIKTAQNNVSSIITTNTSSLQKDFIIESDSYNNLVIFIQNLKTDINKGNLNGQQVVINIQSSSSYVGDLTNNLALSIRRSHSIILDILNQLVEPGTDVPDNWGNYISSFPPTNSGSYTTSVSYDFSTDLKFQNGIHGTLIIKTYNNGTATGVCAEKTNFHNQNLQIFSPIAYGCRKSSISSTYTPQPPPSTTTTSNTATTPLTKTAIVQNGKVTTNPTSSKPSIDTIKKIIAKTLQESYYFKQLEDTNPIAFKSLREKLKYFHPGFHSMTPEGLNSRLTFLQQCLRPGDTIPIKGTSEPSDIGARNTTFGPPPICVLRIGDFYHSKIVITDLNITYEDSTWDLNPDGIGVQPMIANVTLQIAFIGGQGLETPVNTLQNALSSNFYANTEMYDERSTDTNTTIGGQTVEAFTKSFLDDLQKPSPKTASSNNNSNGNKLSSQKYIGDLQNSSSDGTDGQLEYIKLITDVFTQTTSYFTKFESTYNGILTNYGSYVVDMLLSNNYRTINQYNIFNQTSPTPQDVITLFGLFTPPSDSTSNITVFGDNLLSALNGLSYSDLCTIFGFNFLTDSKQQIVNQILFPWLLNYVGTVIENLNQDKTISTFESTRNNLISCLDKMNFIVQYGLDGQLTSDTVGIMATLDGFVSSDFYSNYSTCIDYIKSNTNEYLYTHFNNDINFNGSYTFTNNQLSDILAVFLNGQTDKILGLFSSNSLLNDNNTVNKMTKSLNKFIYKPAEITFKTNGTLTSPTVSSVEFDISSIDNITDQTMLKNLQNLNSNNVPPINNSLNYYRNPNS